MARKATFVLLLSLSTSGVACDLNNPEYVPAKTPIEAGGPMDTQPTQTVDLPFRAPVQGEQDLLRAEAQEKKIRVPWLPDDHVALSLQYTITNLADQPGVAQIHVNGANQYTLYDPIAIRASLEMSLPGDDAEDVFLPSLIQTVPTTIAPGEHLQGNIREDDFKEAALDLFAFGTHMAPYDAVLINRSEVNPIGLDMMPANSIIPQLQHLIVTLQASRHMRLDYVVRIRQDRDYLFDGEPDRNFRPNPMAFTPMVKGAMP